MISLFLDEDVHKKAATALRSRGFDVVCASESGRKGLSDEEQLEFAADSGRVLFSFNIRDYVRLHKAWLEENRYHAGIMVSQQTDISTLVRKLSRKIQVLTPEAVAQQIFWL